MHSSKNTGSSGKFSVFKAKLLAMYNFYKRFFQESMKTRREKSESNLYYLKKFLKLNRLLLI